MRAHALGGRAVIVLLTLAPGLGIELLALPGISGLTQRCGIFSLTRWSFGRWLLGAGGLCFAPCTRLTATMGLALAARLTVVVANIVAVGVIVGPAVATHRDFEWQGL